ncbi:MAG: DUF2071 domain-containing protein, partial [Acidobacteriota bacterium]
FAIVTYCVEPDALRKHLHPRFTPDLIRTEEGEERALISVVTFLDRDFRFANLPWPKYCFGQTNYRAYVIDRETGEHVVWFFGTCLDSWTVAIPRHLWKLPWHRAKMDFQCRYDEQLRRYAHYAVRTSSQWAPAELTFDDSGKAPERLIGFSNLEAGLVLLTHPLRGYFFRRDGSLGGYSIWHERVLPTMATPTVARFPVLDRLGLVPAGELAQVHSVMVQRRIAFTIYLPPTAIHSKTPQ